MFFNGSIVKEQLKILEIQLPASTYLSIYANLKKLQEEDLIIKEKDYFTLNKKESKSLLISLFLF